MSEPFEPITPEELPKFVGKLVHVSWANPACAWELVWIMDKEFAIIQTRRSGKKLKVKQSHLFKTRNKKYGRK